MKSFKSVFWALVATLVLNGAAYAQAGVTLTYQGTLNDAGGQAINASRAMTFRIYDDPGGGVAIWESSYADVAIVDGIFSVVLGAQRAFNDTMVQADNLYLGVTVGQDQEMRPRMRIGGALKSQWAAVAAHARDVRGEDIHPSSVSINDMLVSVV